jgi:hypothetical protein
MKKVMILCTAIFLFFGFASLAAAGIYNEGYNFPLPSASFWAVDGNADGSVTIASGNYVFLGGAVQYRYGSEIWKPLASSNSIIIEPGSGGQTQVFLRYLQGSGSTISAATMFYTGKINPSDSNSPLYHNVGVNFGGNALSMDTAAGSDSVSPVPLPGAVWLLGAGLLGLVGIRRRLRS